MAGDAVSFRVPYGVDELGNYVSPEMASKQTVYFCPCCANRLVFKSGTKRVKHFSHPKAANCNPETVLHKTAKALIQRAIMDNAEGELCLSIMDNCQCCGGEQERLLKPKTFSNAVQEVRVGQYICDVVAFKGEGEIALGIEILVTHAVDEEKAKNLNIYWIELKANDVIESATMWQPVQAKLRQSNCLKCKEEAQRVRKIAAQYGIDGAMFSTDRYAVFRSENYRGYLGFVGECWACKRDIPLFWWADMPFCTQRPPEPRPKTIQFRFSKTGKRSYWANTCATCTMIQGVDFVSDRVKDLMYPASCGIEH